MNLYHLDELSLENVINEDMLLLKMITATADQYVVEDDYSRKDDDDGINLSALLVSPP